LEAEFGVFSLREGEIFGEPKFGGWDYWYCSSQVFEDFLVYEERYVGA